jgi:hypothetical protein
VGHSHRLQENVLVVHAENTHQRSFWADGDDGEIQLFMDMLDYLKPYREYSLVHYGAYEIRALRRYSEDFLLIMRAR